MNAGPGSRHTAVCIGIVTRERREMLARLLDSLLRLDLEGLECSIAIVENSAEATLADLIEEFSRGMSAPVRYEIEPRLGIAPARNHALRMALESGADCLAFIDDDETADPAWLRNLVESMCSRNLHVVGGPVLIDPASRPAQAGRALGMWDDLAKTMSPPAALTPPKRVNEGDLELATNNWLVDLAFVRTHDLSFDESIGFAGGEDTRFYYAAKAKGARTGWAKDAIVFEYVPLSRLTFAYQYRCYRDRSISSFQMKYRRRTPAMVLRALGTAFGKGATAASIIIAALVRGRPVPLKAARHLGFSIGRLQGLMGRNSRHYENVTK